MNVTNLKDAEFRQFQTWLYDKAGISLSDAKKALVSGRLSKRLQHHSLSTYGDYFKLITTTGEAAEQQIALDLLTTNETYFFREPKHFDFLRDQILREATPGKLFRLWCGASSSGEEPYTLAMTLAEGLKSTPWEMVASDISTKVLDMARAGHYPLERAENIPKHLLSKYCLKGTGSQEGTFIIEPQLRSRVQFMQINLNTNLPRMGEFDVIFLRNVMIYFDVETKRRVVARAVQLLKPGGYFVVSHSESLNGVTDALKVVTPSIYRKP
ncbi:MAG: protein-glutamate O-methyltransferase CheR [Betaproteobacteria bacterium]|nr:protein-glutamate O-methyltransferase CheR [Betaproteobacteria bacterium]